MNHQTEIYGKTDLLDAKGRLTAPGWARQPFWAYDRNMIKTGPLRIKEWDYYYVLSDSLKRGITFTISDLGYAGLIAVCWLDFDNKSFAQEDTLALFPLGKITRNPGAMSFNNNKISLRYDVDGLKRKICFNLPSRDISGEIVLEEPAGGETMNIATSWKENRRRFYYNRKINNLAASGSVRAKGKTFAFDPETDFGGLDWGRGAWTYDNRWYWSSASGLIAGEPFGFNLGYGFSDRSPATENALFYRGRAHKLEEVTFHYDPFDYMKSWRFSSSDGRFEADFTPLVDRNSQVDLKLIKSVQHQVFGRFNGTAKLDDGTVLEMKDYLGFAEDVYNRW